MSLPVQYVTSPLAPFIDAGRSALTPSVAPVSGCRRCRHRLPPLLSSPPQAATRTPQASAAQSRKTNRLDTSSPSVSSSVAPCLGPPSLVGRGWVDHALERTRWPAAGRLVGGTLAHASGARAVGSHRPVRRFTRSVSWRRMSVEELDPLLSDEGWAYASTPPVEPGDLGRFHALFGRDGLICALQVMPARNDVARATLRALAARQGRREDPEIEEEPGKIGHEFRADARRRSSRPATPRGATTGFATTRRATRPRGSSCSWSAWATPRWPPSSRQAGAPPPGGWRVRWTAAGASCATRRGTRAARSCRRAGATRDHGRDGSGIAPRRRDAGAGRRWRTPTARPPPTPRCARSPG